MRTVRRPQHLRRRAFTLIEILMVVIILGIASAIVVPNIGQRNDLIAAAAARVVVADLMYAQNRAILTQAMRYVNVDVPNQKYSLLISKPNAGTLVYEQNTLNAQNYVTQFSTGAVGTTAGLKSVALQAVNVDGATCIGFDELGCPYSVDVATGNSTPLVNAATIPVKCGNFTLTVYVEPYTGALSVQ
jgi:prepilin-type N-terminal cleavage/methylation domain-containing protein